MFHQEPSFFFHKPLNLALNIFLCLQFLNKKYLILKVHLKCLGAFPLVIILFFQIYPYLIQKIFCNNLILRRSYLIVNWLPMFLHDFLQAFTYLNHRLLIVFLKRIYNFLIYFKFFPTILIRLFIPKDYSKIIIVTVLIFLKIFRIQIFQKMLFFTLLINLYRSHFVIWLLIQF